MKTKGITLIELMVSIFIASFVFIMLFMIFDSGKDSYTVNMGSLSLQNVVRKALSEMECEIRQSRSSSITITSSGGRINFQIPKTMDPVTYSSTISYYLNGTQLIREHPSGTQQILAVNVDSLNFSLSGNMLTIDIDLRQEVNARREVTLELKKNVLLRN